MMFMGFVEKVKQKSFPFSHFAVRAGELYLGKEYVNLIVFLFNSKVKFSSSVLCNLFAMAIKVKVQSDDCNLK